MARKPLFKDIFLPQDGGIRVFRPGEDLSDTGGHVTQAGSALQSLAAYSAAP